MDRGEIRVGLSGWSYRGWRGRFYPKGLAQARELEYASRQVRSLEINGSFYSLKTPSVYAMWHDAAPADFVFSVKGSRFITHLKRLKDVRVPLANFTASGVLGLDDKLGPFLWQLPPGLAFEPQSLGAFLALLPTTTAEAVALAQEHDDRVKMCCCGSSATASYDDRPLRHALEVRDPSYADNEAIALLAAHGVALVVADTAGRWPLLEQDTADFRYVRLHGHEQLYASSYTDSQLQAWASKVREWAGAGQDVYVYFDNDMHAAAPRNAVALASLLGVGPGPDER